ncbi:unnamed protein product [Diabrotica balteata]|uniref:Reverse transcriptase domain-containing protein n=1 Tax=Diabrotica balteata TaxID=107213 RepID=A0A9P0E4G7_DIABA|nr:unnamed protein product [Diabrotica balteata]
MFKLPRTMSKIEQIKFLQYLSTGLDDRIPIRIFQRFRTLFREKVKTGRYSAKEDKQILDFMRKTKSWKPYHDLGILLNRVPKSVEDRARTLLEGIKNVRWDMAMAERLIKALLKATGKRKAEDLEQIALTSDQWKEVSSLLDNIPVAKIKSGWKINVHPKLFETEATVTVKKDLIRFPDGKVKNEIDFILSNFNNIAKDVTILNSVNTGSDRRLVRVRIEALYGIDKGILLNGERVNNVRYADDTMVIANSLEGLQRLMDRINEYSQQYGLNINTHKTTQMIISKENINKAHLYINGTQIERVKQYCYLVTIINEQWSNLQKKKCRIGKARTAWTLTDTTIKKLEAFEMWLYRRMLRISWTARITNKEVLGKIKKEPEIVFTIKRIQLQYLGHVMRNQHRYSLLQSILQGKVKGKRGPGRRRISWLRNLRTCFKKTSTELFRAAVSKVMIANMISNIRNG